MCVCVCVCVWWGCKQNIYKNTKEQLTKDCILSFPKKGNLETNNSYRGIILSALLVNVYNTLLPNRVRTEIERIFKNSQ